MQLNFSVILLLDLFITAPLLEDKEEKKRKAKEKKYPIWFDFCSFKMRPAFNLVEIRLSLRFLWDYSSTIHITFPKMVSGFNWIWTYSLSRLRSTGHFCLFIEVFLLKTSSFLVLSPSFLCNPCTSLLRLFQHLTLNLSAQAFCIAHFAFVLSTGLNFIFAGDIMSYLHYIWRQIETD